PRRRACGQSMPRASRDTLGARIMPTSSTPGSAAVTTRSPSIDRLKVAHRCGWSLARTEGAKTAPAGPLRPTDTKTPRHRRSGTLFMVGGVRAVASRRKTTMDRREWLGLVGAGVGVSLEGSALQADEQGHAKTEDRSLMAPVHELHAHFCGI